MRLWRASVAALMVALASCTQAPPPADRLNLRPVAFAELPGWSADDVAAALPALRRSCERFLALPTDRAVGQDGLAGTAGDWQAPCGALRRVAVADHAALRAWMTEWFLPFRAANNDRSEGLFTGYYLAQLRGSRQPGGAYTVPIFGRPADLVTIDLGQFKPEWKNQSVVGRVRDGKVRPYPPRAEIDGGALGDAAPIIWVDDPLDALLLHIQGSGRVALDDGTVVHIGYAASNGHPFVGIGRVLLDSGKIPPDQASMQSIIAWLRAHPREAPALLATNPRYIFFRELKGDGPVGAFGVPLTPERSLAVDVRFVPLGVPVWLATRDPDGAPLNRLMVAQDAGAAINGPVRGDFYWGHGDAAFDKAGRMKSRGEYFLLLPRHRTVRTAAGDLAISGGEVHPRSGASPAGGVAAP